MIQLQRKKPLKLSKLETLKRRLADPHPKQQQVERKLSQYAAGYRGEQAIDYHLKFVHPSHMFFHGLRLHDQISHFQIDTLLLTPSFILIEVKNIAGTLCFDPDRNQMIRKSNGIEEGFSDPRLQVKRHHLQFEKWLQRQQIPILPIFHVVVISFPATIIHAPPSSLGKVIHAAQLPYDIFELEKAHPDPIISARVMNQFASRLIRNHHPVGS